MNTSLTSQTRKARRDIAVGGRPSIGIRELKAKASAIIEDVKGRRVTYAVTKRGKVESTTFLSWVRRERLACSCRLWSWLRWLRP